MTIKFDYASVYFVTKVTICNTCDGFGFVDNQDFDPENGELEAIKDCKDCKGKGSTIKTVPLDIALSELGFKIPVYEEGEQS